MTGSSFVRPAGARRVEGSAQLRVLLCDDQDLVRTGFRMLLAAAPDTEVVGEATDGVQAVELALQLVPDVVVMDIRMPRLDGIEATRRIVGEPSLRHTRVLMLTTFDADEYVYAALRAGASGFLLKDASAADLLAAIRAVAAGEALLAPSVTAEGDRPVHAAGRPTPRLARAGPAHPAGTGGAGPGGRWSEQR
jgi:DNA-binding NarL/FixJ family response regulator